MFTSCLRNLCFYYVLLTAHHRGTKAEKIILRHSKLPASINEIQFNSSEDSAIQLDATAVGGTLRAFGTRHNSISHLGETF